MRTKPSIEPVFTNDVSFDVPSDTEDESVPDSDRTAVKVTNLIVKCTGRPNRRRQVVHGGVRSALDDQWRPV